MIWHINITMNYVLICFYMLLKFWKKCPAWHTTALRNTSCEGAQSLLQSGSKWRWRPHPWRGWRRSSFCFFQCPWWDSKGTWRNHIVISKTWVLIWFNHLISLKWGKLYLLVDLLYWGIVHAPDEAKYSSSSFRQQWLAHLTEQQFACKFVLFGIILAMEYGSKITFPLNMVRLSDESMIQTWAEQPWSTVAGEGRVFLYLFAQLTGDARVGADL